MKKKNVTEVSCDKELPVQLTEKEVIVYSREMARIQGEKIEREEKKKSVAAEYTAEIKSLSGDVDVLMRKINSNSEQRNVKCKWVMKWDQMEKELVRLDTNEVVRTITILDSERQQHMDFKKAERQEASKAPYGIWNGEKFIDNPTGERIETTTVKAALKIMTEVKPFHEKVTLTVISISEKPLTETIGEQAEEPGAFGAGD